jgi:hypothetical protein
MSRQRSDEYTDPRHFSRDAMHAQHDHPGRVIIRPTIVCGDPPPYAESFRRFELQRLLEEPLTVPLGSMLPLLAAALHADYAPYRSPPHSQRAPQTSTARLARDRARFAAAATYEDAEEAATAPARPTRARRLAQRAPHAPADTWYPPPSAASAAAARWLARSTAWRAPQQPSAAATHAARQRASAEHRHAPARVARERPQPQTRPRLPAAAPASMDAPWHPHTRPPTRPRHGSYAYHRSSARGAWTWPVALSLCSMLLAYAITARLLSRAALEHEHAAPAALAKNP